MLKLKPKFLREDGQAKFAVFSMKDYAEIREALENAEDFRVLEESKRRNADKRTYTLDEVKRSLGITTPPRKVTSRKRASRRNRNSA